MALSLTSRARRRKRKKAGKTPVCAPAKPAVTPKGTKGEAAAGAKGRAARKRKSAKRKPVCKPARPKRAAPAPRGGGMHPAPTRPAAGATTPGAVAPAGSPSRPSAGSVKPAATPKPTPAAKPPPAVPDLPAPRPPAAGGAYSGPVYSGAFGAREAERLLWRAGFGPAPGDVERLAALGLDGAVRALMEPGGEPVLTGPAPTYESDGVSKPIKPASAWGHDHLYWLDRMVRSSHQFSERMALILHDWFATTNDAVGSQQLMLDQTEVFRSFGLGDFETLLLEVTRDPAMLCFLNGTSNRKGAINENYAREVMELFALGADRGAYSEQDVRELARALSGWRDDWSAELGNHNFRWDRTRWDDGAKTVFGKTGNHDWRGACRLLVDHPLHASFVVSKLWGYFVPGEPPRATAEALERLYVASGRRLGPVVEAILRSPELYGDARLVKPPVVGLAGMLRARGKGITGNHWTWLCNDAGQRLYHPPDVAGWRDDAWLDTSTVRGRWYLVNYVIEDDVISDGYPAETPEEAVDRALEFWGRPSITPETRAMLVSWSAAAAAALPWGDKYAQRQNSLRQLIGVSPDAMTS